MPQKYLIFVNNIALHVLSDDQNISIDAGLVNCSAHEDFESILLDLEEGRIDTEIRIRLLGIDDPKAFVYEHFTDIKAAGGVVWNHDKCLLIHRLGWWDLPKGKIEADETAERAARREICEETGVCKLELISELGPTYHSYRMKGKRMLKTTFWYIYSTMDDQELLPQVEEDILEVKWVESMKVKEYLGRMYPSLHPVILEALGNRS